MKDTFVRTTGHQWRCESLSSVQIKHNRRMEVIREREQWIIINLTQVLLLNFSAFIGLQL